MRERFAGAPRRWMLVVAVVSVSIASLAGPISVGLGSASSVPATRSVHATAYFVAALPFEEPRASNQIVHIPDTGVGVRDPYFNTVTTTPPNGGGGVSWIPFAAGGAFLLLIVGSVAQGSKK
jgi:hypothetical protein